MRKVRFQYDEVIDGTYTGKKIAAEGYFHQWVVLGKGLNVGYTEEVYAVIELDNGQIIKRKYNEIVFINGDQK